jgi:hypothetical protein
MSRVLIVFSYFSYLKKILILIGYVVVSFPAFSKEESEWGAWNMYFGNFRFTETPWAMN